jgi:DNA-binding LacI/PurR family transcriptional regulator
MTDLDPRRKVATMGDVARLAGVSPQTVSRVVNANDYVGGETRERVRAAMRQLNYRPNRAAQALVTGRTRTLGVVSVESVGFGPSSVLLGLERAARTAGYAISVARLAAFDRSELAGALERLQRQGVEGILVNMGHESLTRELLEIPVDVPLLAVEDLGDPAEPAIAVDDQAAAAMAATRLLLDLGHRTVLHLAGPRDWAAAQRRIDGWRAALDEAGAEPPPVLHGDWSAGSGYDIGRRLALDRGVTAIFAANDEMALGVIRAMFEARRDVPREVSIVGFDDVPFARYLTPPLTTVRQDFDEIGRRGVELLLNALHGSSDAVVRGTFTPELVVRESTAPPPSPP